MLWAPPITKFIRIGRKIWEKDKILIRFFCEVLSITKIRKRNYVDGLRLRLSKNVESTDRNLRT